MQVAAYTSGQDSVGLLDCMLLQHVLWQQPSHQTHITDFLVSQISEDDGLTSAAFLFKGEGLPQLVLLDVRKQPSSAPCLFDVRYIKLEMLRNKCCLLQHMFQNCMFRLTSSSLA